MRVFVYCRVSSKEQGTDDHYSLDNQAKRCDDYAKMKQWRNVVIRKDVASGKNDNRPGFQDLLMAIKSGRIDVVVVYRLDRLSRNVRDIYDFLDMIKLYNVAFVSVTEGFDTTTAMGRAMLGVAAVFAQLTREMISENTKDGLLRRREAGFFTGSLTRMFGYTYSKKDGVLEVDEKESSIIQQIFELYGEAKFGTPKIASLLNAQQISTKGGAEWSDSKVRAILTNPLYCGRLRIAEENRIVKSQHPAIVSEEQFDLVQQILQGRAKYPNRSQQSQYLLSGLARCAECGKRLKVHTSVGGKNKSPYKSYYHAGSEKLNDGVCKGLSKGMHVVDQAVISKIGEIAQSGTIEKLVLADVKTRNGHDLQPKIREREKMLLELKGLEDKFTQWADRLDTGKIDEEQFEQQNLRLLERKKVLHDRTKQLNSEIGGKEQLEINLAEAKNALQNFSRVWEVLEIEEKRELLRLLIEDLKVGRHCVQLKLLFVEPITLTYTSRAS